MMMPPFGAVFAFYDKVFRMSETLHNNERQLSIKELERLIFLSFMHSQGSPSLQEALIVGMRDWYGVQSEDRVHQAFGSFFSSQYDSVQGINLANKNLHIDFSPELFEKELGSVNTFCEPSNSKYGSDDYFSLLFLDLFARDDKYISSTGGRPNRKDTSLTDNFAHRYFSFLKSYMLESKPTGDPALDKVYSDMLTWFKSKPTCIGELNKLLNEQARRLATTT
jgi:hypothetical protein